AAARAGRVARGALGDDLALAARRRPNLQRPEVEGAGLADLRLHPLEAAPGARGLLRARATRPDRVGGVGVQVGATAVVDVVVVLTYECSDDVRDGPRTVAEAVSREHRRQLHGAGTV